MKSMPRHIQIIPYLIPLVLAVYLAVLNIIDSPASLTRIDPEYLCLLNGLNVSILHFDNIGYTDLPGTPFLVLTGIFIRIIHLTLGEGAIVDDVILRPDFYIQVSSYLLITLVSIVLIWGGKKVFKATNNVLAVLFLQSSFLFSSVCLSLQIRYSADRLLPLLVFIFAVVTILYLYKSIGSRKYALYSGIILGIGFITKFNFVVLSILPVFIFVSIKDWLVYIGSFIGSSFISFLPIINKFQDVKRFITNLINHDGMYGQGNQQVFNFEKMFHNIKEIPALNEGFTILVAFSVAAIIFLGFSVKIRKSKKKEFLFLVGFLLAVFIEIVMVSKHFKNYYLAPVLAMSGIVLYFVWDILVYQSIQKKKWSEVAGIITLVLFIIFPVLEVNSHSKNTIIKKENRKKTVEYLKKNIQPSDYFFLEPSWISGPMVENGLLFGISYVAGKNDFTKVYLKHYPNILTYEGDGRPIKHFRTKDADLNTVLKEGNTVYLFSTPGRNTKKLAAYLLKLSEVLHVEIKFDTVFVNSLNKDILIRAGIFKNDSTQLPEETISFFNDIEGDVSHWRQNARVTEKAFSGSGSSKILKGNKYSSTFEINPKQLFGGPISSININCKFFQPDTKNAARLIIEAVGENINRFWYSVACKDYIEKENSWENFKYQIYLPEYISKADRIQIYFYNSAKHPVYIDNLTIEFTQKTI